MKKQYIDKHNSGSEALSNIKGILRYVKLLAVICIILLIFVPVLLHKNGGQIADRFSKDESAEIAIISANFEIPPFDDTEEGRLAEYGHRLITETYALIGPGTELGITGNRLACGSCHLDGGTKPFAAPYIGLSGIFPMYSGRENRVGSLEERINGCFERSMNGKAIDVNSREMRAMISYIKHISKDAPVGKRVRGQGFVNFAIPDRAADVGKGALVYENTCQTCHGVHGEGLKGTVGNREGGYIYPPLWGDDTYNDGAGMARLITAAKFIKGNMPLGVTHDAPLLSDEEAYDVAAYINSHSRPVKANKELDYPILAKKPKDCPYPPYEDDIPQNQHKIGPFNF
ncbi:c-type cytochrome [Sphingobacterium chuzhouense]|uniref:C-type cytochrome n=1 Tax=Sphingobacterium chuzhouense TaxID=1742264 RepID=A0ABR7XQ28_9SPHI|nr:c-type cytochrome [Sphingobacterium chuzhouense]MBD1421289.1 c-type cytochrome [Sphingobacterium chuzhouense]